VISIELIQALGIAASLLSAIGVLLFSAGKLLVKQFERRLDERFEGLERARSESTRHWDNKFESLQQAAADNEREMRRMERDVMTLKADLPINYVRREDYIRNQSILEAKIDGVAIRIENALLKGDKHG
jgi:hypothetical protein